MTKSDNTKPDSAKPAKDDSEEPTPQRRGDFERNSVLCDVCGGYLDEHHSHTSEK